MMATSTFNIDLVLQESNDKIELDHSFILIYHLINFRLANSSHQFQFDSRCGIGDVWYDQSVRVLLFWQDDNRILCKNVRLRVFRAGLACIFIKATKIRSVYDAKYAKADLLPWVRRSYHGFENVHWCK